MTTESGAASTLLELADRALGSYEDSEERIIAIEAYCTRFKELEAALQTDEPDLALLADKHQQVLRVARELLSGTTKDIQKFKHKARGIMAYVDILPQKINVTGTKKG